MVGERVSFFFFFFDAKKGKERATGKKKLDLLFLFQPPLTDSPHLFCASSRTPS